MGGEDAEDKDADKAATFAATSADRTTIRVSYASLIRTFERLHIELKDISQSLKAGDTAKD